MTINPSALADSDCAVFVSFAGGRTWAQHSFGVAGCADPWVVLRGDGTALFAGLQEPRGNDMWVARWEDGGRTWASVPVAFGGPHDHETAVEMDGVWARRQAGRELWSG